MPADLGQLVPRASGLLEAVTQTCSLRPALEPVGSGTSLLHHLPTYLLSYPWSPNNPFLLFSGSLCPPSRQPPDPSADHGIGEQSCEVMTPPARCPLKALPLFPRQVSETSFSPSSLDPAPSLSPELNSEQSETCQAKCDSQQNRVTPQFLEIRQRVPVLPGEKQVQGNLPTSH